MVCGGSALEPNLAEVEDKNLGIRYEYPGHPARLVALLHGLDGSSVGCGCYGH
jgi:hypothetical protein